MNTASELSVWEIMDRVIEVIGALGAEDWLDQYSATLGDRPSAMLNTTMGRIAIMQHLQTIERESFRDL